MLVLVPKGGSCQPTPRLTTTTYGVLGLLAVRPHSTYELAKAMGRSVGRVWPRAQSKLFEEPKKLVRHGYADARRGFRWPPSAHRVHDHPVRPTRARHVARRPRGRPCARVRGLGQAGLCGPRHPRGRACHHCPRPSVGSRDECRKRRSRREVLAESDGLSKSAAPPRFCSGPSSPTSMRSSPRGRNGPKPRWPAGLRTSPVTGFARADARSA